MKKDSENRWLESFWDFEFRPFRESIGSLHLIAVPARQILTSTIVSALLLFAHGAWSTETLVSTLWESCKGDLAEFCSNVQPKRGGLLTCIYAHDSMISTECGMALNEATLQFEQGVKIWAPVLSACEADYESHCPTTKAGNGRILRCLSKKIHKMGGVSRGCYLALEKAGFLQTQVAEFWPTLAVGVAARTAQFLCLEAAVEREPDFSDGHSALAAAYINGDKFNYAHSRPDAIERAYPRIQGAIELNSQNQRAYQMLAIYRYLTEQPGFDAAARQAIAINPNNSLVVANLGTFILCLDDYRRGEFGKSLDCVLKMSLTKSQLVQTLLAANYSQLGESEKGEKTIDLILEIHPTFANDPGVPFRTRRISEDLIDSVMEGLRKAGYDMLGETS